MKTLIGLGTALTIATAPIALQAEPRLGIQGGGAVMQMLGAAISGNAKEVHKAEKKLRKAARKAGVPVSLSTVAAAATGGAAVQRTTTQAAPAPSLAPQRVAERPRLRPVSFETAQSVETPPVTTVQNGTRVETSALATTFETAPDTTPVARRVTSTAATAPVSTSSSVATTEPQVVQAESDTATPGADTDQPVLAEAASAPRDGDPALFSGQTGY